jgi:lantibiotic modifying enzyme
MYWLYEGTSGIALTFLKAYVCLGDPTYKQFANGALLNCPRLIVDNNLSQYQGLCGLGEVYLEAYRILGDSEWIERADWIAQVIMHLKREHPQHGPYWLVQNERQPTSDFMGGNSGVIHYLLRYCFPDKIGLPLLNNQNKR